MKKNKSSFNLNNTGISLLMVLLIVLCFAIFAILSLKTAQDDYQSSKAFAERKASYYDACNSSEEALQLLASGDSKAAESKINEIDKKANFSYDNNVASWSIKFSGTQQLEVQASINSGDATISKWQTSTIGE